MSGMGGATPRDHVRDHGGDLAEAVARHGGVPGDWIDLSTGINRVPWPLPAIPAQAWQGLPGRALFDAALSAARAGYGTDAPGVALAGAQAAIQLVPRLRAPGRVRLRHAGYNEYAPAFADAGWRVERIGAGDDLGGADAAVLTNPNNPDGAAMARDEVLRLAGRVGLLLVDESFADVRPDLSVASEAGKVPGLIVLRSFGKFFGLAGLRLGFAFGMAEDMARLGALAGPWAASGPALAVGAAALADADWQARSRARLTEEAARLDALARAAGWQAAGGCDLFRLYETGDAQAARDRLAGHRIWSRAFPYSPGWLRLGLPGDAGEWARLEAALAPGAGGA